MQFKDLFFTKQQPQLNPTPVELITKNDSAYSVQSIKFSSNSDIPNIIESKNSEWVKFGDDNLYPQELIDLFHSCAIHQAIVTSKSKMVAGDGFTYNDSNLDEKQRVELIQFLNYCDGKNSLQELVDGLSLDNQIFGAFALEIIWNQDFTKIIKIKRIDVSKIRSGKYVNDEVEEYFYSRDWGNGKEERIRIASFDVTNKDDHNQLLYVKNSTVGTEYYGIPSYSAAINWIKLDSNVGQFHKSNIENGFNPSFTIKFYQKPNSPEEKNEITNNIKKHFGGVKNTGKAMVFFSDGKELAPDVDPVNVSNIDKQFTVIADQIVRQILSGHRVTSSELFGIATAGKLGTSELPIAYKIFHNTVIQVDQVLIEKNLNKILRVNGLDINLKIKELKTIE